MVQGKPILGVTLYSFTNEWLHQRYTLDQLVEQVARAGLGPAVEVVGFQSFRTFPDVTDEFARHFRNLLEKHELLPSCLGANCDVGRRRDRLMTSEEILVYLDRQMVTAQKLGVPVMRIQSFIGPKLFEQLAPLAEKRQVHVACELHSPLSVDHPEVVELRQCFDRVQSEYIGFIPDFSSTMTAPPNRYWDKLRSMGAAEGLIEAAQGIWLTEQPNPQKYAALAEAAAHFNAGEAVAGQLNLAMTMFGHMPVDKLAELLPYTHHIHGKFYEIDADGREPSIPYPRIIALLLEKSYQGTISAEWEGHAFTQEMIGFAQVQAWQSMCARLLGE